MDPKGCPAEGQFNGGTGLRGILLITLKSAAHKAWEIPSLKAELKFKPFLDGWGIFLLS